MDSDDGKNVADRELLARLDAFAQHRESGSPVLPWVDRLSPRQREWLRSDLAVVLAEPEVTGEPVDWREIGEILREWAEVASWDDVLVRPGATAAAGLYVVDMREEDRESLARASAAVRSTMDRLLAEFLPFYPTAGQFLLRSRLKKLRERDVWQIQLPDGYRLRYEPV